MTKLVEERWDGNLAKVRSDRFVLIFAHFELEERDKEDANASKFKTVMFPIPHGLM